MFCFIQDFWATSFSRLAQSDLRFGQLKISPFCTVHSAPDAQKYLIQVCVANWHFSHFFLNFSGQMELLLCFGDLFSGPIIPAIIV